MKVFLHRDRVGLLDERSRRFVNTVAWLGGYVTPEQAQELGIRNSVPRVHVQLKDLESWGFIKRVATYPAVYQVTKSVTRLIGSDLAARREHPIETIRTRLLTVNFYLEAMRWPVEFVFDHRQKISRLAKLGCETLLLPGRCCKPYLWQDIVFQRPSNDLVIAMVDHFGRNSHRQLYRLLKRFAPSLGLDKLRLMVVVGSDRREQLFSRHLKHTRLQRLLDEQGVSIPLRQMVTIYHVRRTVPIVRPLITDRKKLRELRTLRLASQALGGSPQQDRHAIHKTATHTTNGISAERGGISW